MKKISSLCKSFSFIIFAIIASIFIAKLFFIPGITTKLKITPNFQAIIINVLFITILIESLLKRISPFFSIFPILFFGVYYSIYFYEKINFTLLESEVLENNEPINVEFDLKNDILVFDTENYFVAKYFLEEYDIPIVYYKNNIKKYKSDYFSYHIINHEKCTELSSLIKSHKLLANQEGVSIRRFEAPAPKNNYCHVTIPDELPNDSNIIKITQSNMFDIKWNHKILEKLQYNISNDAGKSQTIESLIPLRLATQRLAPVPLLYIEFGYKMNNGKVALFISDLKFYLKRTEASPKTTVGYLDPEIFGKAFNIKKIKISERDVKESDMYVERLVNKIIDSK